MNLLKLLSDKIKSRRRLALLLVVGAVLSAPLLTGFTATVSAAGERYRYIDANTIEVTGPDINGAVILRVQPGTSDFVGDVNDKRNGCTWSLKLDVDDANPAKGTLSAPAFVFCVGPDAHVLDNWDKGFVIAPIGSPQGSGGGTGAESRCAVMNYGTIPCPTTGQVPSDGGCYIRDPGAPNPADRNRWIANPACDSPAFNPPTAIDCSANVTPDNDRNGDGLNDYCDPASACQGDQCDLVKKYINPLIRVMSAIVGIGVTISIIWAGIQYASSADDPQKVAAAKRRILVAMLTLIGYFLLFQFLDWIIPGGIG